MSTVCTKSDWEGEVVGAACPDCGHTNAVHPGVHNPVLDACVLCRLRPRGMAGSREPLCVIAEEEHDGDVQVVTLETEELGPLDLSMCRLHRDRLQADIIEHLSIAEDTDG